MDIQESKHTSPSTNRRNSARYNSWREQRISSSPRYVSDKSTFCDIEEIDSGNPNDQSALLSYRSDIPTELVNTQQSDHDKLYQPVYKENVPSCEADGSATNANANCVTHFDHIDSVNCATGACAAVADPVDI